MSSLPDIYLSETIYRPHWQNQKLSTRFCKRNWPRFHDLFSFSSLLLVPYHFYLKRLGIFGINTNVVPLLSLTRCVDVVTLRVVLDSPKHLPLTV